MTLLTSIPIFDGRKWSSTPLNPAEAEAATRAERSGFLVVDQHTGRLDELWFSWCETRNRPAILVKRRKRGRATVSLDLLCTDRCLTGAGWQAIVSAYERRGSRAMQRVQRHGLAFPDYVFGTVPWPAADRLARELIAIVGTGSFVRVCDRPPDGVSGR